MLLGLAGVFLVGSEPIPSGFGAPSQVVPMVLNDAGVIGLSLNGKSFPATLPVMAKVNETVEIHYSNEGLQIHPMHLHGIAQTIIARDGFPLANPELADTVNVAPGCRTCAPTITGAAAAMLSSSTPSLRCVISSSWNPRDHARDA